MYINDIDFPNPILDAIKENKLVIFAGAGASMGAPTSLPDFRNLAKEIAEGTGETLKKDDSCEVFLGKLKAKGVPVNEQASDILSGSCLKYNKLHEAIINIFPDPRDIRIVTTNYDQMFEQVLYSREVKPVIYNAPALPLGNDIHGIVHIHGNVSEPKYMIVTDEDFGRAYLTEGYASRFLVRLFEAYDVLFIGYSYKDTIIRYLTRAMSRQDLGKKYILTVDNKSDWSALGIAPIWIPKGGYLAMRESLNKIGVSVKRGLADWRKQLTEISDIPPRDLTIDSEIDYCLENIERSRVLANSLHGKEWIRFLDKKKVFDRCFSNASILSENDIMWANWLCDTFVGKEDERIFRLIYIHNNTLCIEFADIIIRKIIALSSIRDEILAQYIVLLDEYLTDSWEISRLIEILHQRNQYRLLLCLFKKQFCCRMKLQKKIWISDDDIAYKHSFIGKYYDISRTWEMIKETISAEFAYDVLIFAKTKIEEVHDRYNAVNQASKNQEPWEMALLSLEEGEGRRYIEEPLYVLNRMILETACALQEQNGSLLKNILLQNMESESILLRRITLEAIRNTRVFNAKEKLNIILQRDMLYSVFEREQVFLLVGDIFTNLDEDVKNELIDSIIENRTNNDESDNLYDVFNWLVWLQRFDKNNIRVNDYIYKINSEHNYAPREHPELFIESSPTISIPDTSPLLEDELKSLPIEDAVRYMENYSGDLMCGPNRYGLLNVFSIGVSKDYSWTKSFTEILLNKQSRQMDVWEHLFYGLSEAKYKICEFVELLDLLGQHVSDVNYSYQLSRLVFEIVKSVDFKESFTEYSSTIISILEIIWDNRSRKKQSFERIIDLSLNTTTGIVIYTWIYLLSYTKKHEIPEKTKAFFEEALRLRSWEKSVVICVLVGHYNFLFYIDKEWCNNVLNPFLTVNSRNMFSSAWEGMVYFSQRINRDTIELIAPKYLKALKHLDWLQSETKHAFLELLLTLMIHFVDDPTKEFIPELYRSSSETDIVRFINTIETRLMNIDDKEKINWWNDWLKHFLENRKKNKPIPIRDSENEAIMSVLPELEVVFEDAVDTILSGVMPKKVDVLFWHSLDEKQLSSKYPHSMAIVVVKTLNAIQKLDHADLYISRIIKGMDGLGDIEKKQLNEALLRKNIEL